MGEGAVVMALAVADAPALPVGGDQRDQLFGRLVGRPGLTIPLIRLRMDEIAHW